MCVGQYSISNGSMTVERQEGGVSDSIRFIEHTPSVDQLVQQESFGDSVRSASVGAINESVKSSPRIRVSGVTIVESPHLLQSVRIREEESWTKSNSV